MKKNLKYLVILCAMLASCGSGNENISSETSIEYSSLIGTFTYDEVVKQNEIGEDLRIYSSLEDTINGDMYTSSLYPLNSVNGTKVSYGYNQSLRLTRNYTYEYSYTITLTNSEEWGKDFAAIEVNMEGTFDYITADDVNYTVTLSNPSTGTMSIYGAAISGLGSIFSWTKNNTAGYVLDLEKELKANPQYTYNRYMKERTVQCFKGEDRVLTDNIYYFDILNDIAPYCSYSI